MKVYRGWIGLMGPLLSLLVGEEANASTFSGFSNSETKFAAPLSCRLCPHPELRVANKALTLKNYRQPQHKAAPLGSAITVTPKVESSSPSTHQTTIESIQAEQKSRITPDLGLLDKFKPSFDQGVEIIYRLDDR